MGNSLRIKEITDNPTLNIALDTISRGKQALIFCSTKASAEATAEKISLKVFKTSEETRALSDKALHVLSNPTKQCRRLALCLKKGIAFHHSGLPLGQRRLVEDNFRKGEIKIICATTTLAFGLNLPAFRAVIKDLKRYAGRRGMNWIPTLEYHQCIGRAGRPDFNDSYGEAIAVVSSDAEKDIVLERFVFGDPEKIQSKLAVEPVLRATVLSLIATDFVKNEEELFSFFEKTFYAHQYDDIEEIRRIISRILKKLEEWGFLVPTDEPDFVDAGSLGESRLEATQIGMRVSQLYIDPLTAHFLISCMKRASSIRADEFSILHMVSNTIELKPYFRVRLRERQEIEEELAEVSSFLIVPEPSYYDPEYDEFINATKTAIVLREWIEEKDEEYLLEKYNVTPGEFNYKRDSADWIIYSSEELAKELNLNDILKIIRKSRFRLKHGVKEELVPLVRIRGIGRVRARNLYRNGIKDIKGLKNSDLTRLSQIIGKATAIKIKNELGEKQEKIPEGKRKGQLGLGRY